MNEAFFSRFKRLIHSRFRAAFNDIKGETQDSIQAVAIQKIDTTYSEIKHLLGKEEAKKYLVMSKLLELKSDDSMLNQEIQLAITDEHDDLARAAIAKQMVIKDQITELENLILEFDDEMKRMEQYLHDLSSQKKALNVNKMNIAFSVELDEFLDRKKRTINHDVLKSKELVELDELAHAAKVDERLTAFKEKGNLQ